jgi:hypothetical protein
MERRVSAISEEYKDILSAAAKKEGRLLLFTTDKGEWFLDAGDLRLPETQSPLASRKIVETVRDMVSHGLLEPYDKRTEEGVYTLTVKGFAAVK